LRCAQGFRKGRGSLQAVGALKRITEQAGGGCGPRFAVVLRSAKPTLVCTSIRCSLNDHTLFLACSEAARKRRDRQSLSRLLKVDGRNINLTWHGRLPSSASTAHRRSLVFFSPYLLNPTYSWCCPLNWSKYPRFLESSLTTRDKGR